MAAPDRARARSGHRAHRAGVGARAALPADVHPPARPELLVALLRAAALCRARRRALPAPDRAGPREGPRRTVMPHAEMVHWWFATGFLMLGLLLLAEVVVGPEVWNRRPWRRYLWPGLALLLGVLMWPVMTFYTNSTIHMLAHGSWAQALMLAGTAELGVARGKLHSQ